MQTEIGSGDPASAEGVEPGEPADREERRIEALQRIYRSVLEDEQRTGSPKLREIDAALRGEPAID